MKPPENKRSLRAGKLVHPYELSASLRGIKNILFKINLPRNVFLIIDPNVNRLWRQDIDEVFREEFSDVHVFITQEGERAKQISQVLRQWQIMEKKKFGKDTTVIAIGGGTTGDAAGFLASIYMRGVPFVFLPTTLLSMVDSSIGGKNGINSDSSKNLIGTFKMPDLVYACTDFLKTLPEEEWLAGYGEVLKYAFLSRSSSLRLLLMQEKFSTRPSEKLILRLVHSCVKEKMKVVWEDPFETGIRKTLNLGHTFAHAFEIASDFSVSHGRAVHAGIAAALFLSSELKLLPEKKLFEMLRLLSVIPFDINICSLDCNSLLRIMKNDKKNIAKEFQFVLLSGYGRVSWNNSAEKSTICSSLQKAKEYLRNDVPFC